MRRICLVLLLTLAAGCLNDPPATPVFCAPPVADSPVRGPADAWVTMVEFADFECPFCGEAESTLTTLATDYPTDLRLVYKYFPLSIHTHAMAAAIAAECANEQGDFWPMHDLLYAHQDDLVTNSLASYAGQAGVNMDTWQACIASAEAAARVAVDENLGVSAGVSGTPTFFINGQVLEGAESLSDFQSLIDSEVAKAQASGVAQASYYDGLERQACD